MSKVIRFGKNQVYGGRHLYLQSFFYHEQLQNIKPEIGTEDSSRQLNVDDDLESIRKPSLRDVVSNVQESSHNLKEYIHGKIPDSEKLDTTKSAIQQTAQNVKQTIAKMTHQVKESLGNIADQVKHQKDKDSSDEHDPTSRNPNLLK